MDSLFHPLVITAILLTLLIIIVITRLAWRTTSLPVLIGYSLVLLAIVTIIPDDTARLAAALQVLLTMSVAYGLRLLLLGV